MQIRAETAVHFNAPGMISKIHQEKKTSACEHDYVIDQQAEIPDQPNQIYVYFRCKKCNEIKLEILTGITTR
jgi:hypothetical protein